MTKSDIRTEYKIHDIILTIEDGTITQITTNMPSAPIEVKKRIYEKLDGYFLGMEYEEARQIIEEELGVDDIHVACKVG